MITGETLAALEQIITAYARNQFGANGVPPTLARMVIKNVYAAFQEDCLKEVLASRIEIGAPADTGQDKEEGEEADVNEEL